MLDSEFLDTFDAALQSAAPAAFERLGAGISEHELAAIDHQLGGKLPDEMKVWWRRHSGLPTQIFPGHTILGAPEALTQYREHREHAARMADDPFFDDEVADAERWWASNRLPIIAAAGWYSVDLTGAGLASVRYSDWAQIGEDNYASVVAPSLRGWLEPRLVGFTAAGYRDASRGLDFVYDAEQHAWGRV